MTIYVPMAVTCLKMKHREILSTTNTNSKVNNTTVISNNLWIIGRDQLELVMHSACIALRTKWKLDLWQSSLCTGDWRNPPSSTGINIAHKYITRLNDCYFQCVIFSSFCYFLFFKSNYIARHYVLIPTQPLWLKSPAFWHVVVS